MPTYEFISKTPHGKEVRGECRAKNKEDLIRTLGKTGMTVIWCHEKSTEAPSAATRELAKQVAEILLTLDNSQTFKRKRNIGKPSNAAVLAIIVLGGAIWMYYFLDTRIAKLEELSFTPNIVRNLHHHAQQFSD